MALAPLGYSHDTCLVQYFESMVERGRNCQLAIYEYCIPQTRDLGAGLLTRLSADQAESQAKPAQPYMAKSWFHR